MPRYDVLPGIGRVRVYDHGPRYADRYLVLFEDMEVYDGDRAATPTKPRPYGPRQSLSMSAVPSHPQGVSIWDQASPPNTWGPGIRARRIPFAALPERVQAHVIARATEV